jgi:hypothetical protein
MIRGAMTLLFAAGLAGPACGGGGGAGVTCGNGKVCGGDGGPDGNDGGPATTCGGIQPCGGDVVGDWTFESICETATGVAALEANFSSMAANSWCPSQTLVGVGPQASGSLVFDAAGTYSYSLDLVFGGYLDINFPAQCLAGLSCADTTAGLQSQIDDGTYPMPNVTSISCSGSSNCVCRATVNRAQYQAGTYSISGNDVLFAATTGAVTTKSYCVEGNALHLLETSSGSAGQTVIDSDLVAMTP